MTRMAVPACVRVLDLLVPGTGMLWIGRKIEGWQALLAWAILVSLTMIAVCLLEMDPRRCVTVVAILFGTIQALLWLTGTVHTGVPRIQPPLVGLLSFATIIGVTTLSLSQLVEIVTVPDSAQWPGLLAGERLLVRRISLDNTPVAQGELLAAASQKGLVIARLAAGPGDVVDISGPTLIVNGVEITADDLGELRVLGPQAKSPEAKGLRAFRETIAGRSHTVFFARGVLMAKVRTVVPEGHVFLLADNRSTTDAGDSRESGAVPLNRILGRPTAVLWSSDPQGFPRWDRIGAVWP
jgi:signal peptidase I